MKVRTEFYHQSEEDVHWTHKFHFLPFLPFFLSLLTVHLSIFISVINQLDAQKFCFTINLFHASTCFEHMCSKHVDV